MECGHPLPDKGTATTEPSNTTVCTNRPNYERRLLRRRIFFVVFLFLLLGGAVAFFLIQDNRQKAREEQEAFEKLAGCNRLELFEDYLIRFPDGTHVDEVTKLRDELKVAQETALKLDSVDWELAQQLNTGAAYEDYLSKHPDGLFSDLADRELSRLSQLAVSDEEKSMLTGTIHTLLTALASGDASKVNPLLFDGFSFGTTQANGDSLISFYANHFCHADILGVHFSVKGDLEAQKQPNGEASQFDYDVHTRLDATLNRTAVDSAGVQHWELKARLTPDRRFRQVELHRTK